MAESYGASSTNKTGEAYTENRAGRRGNRVPRKMILLRNKIVSVGEGYNARRNQYKSIRYERAGSRGDSSRRGCEGLAEFTLNCGMYEEMYSRTWEAPDIVSYSNTRTWAEYPDRESSCSGVADVLVVLRGRESLLHGEGGHGRT